MLARRARYVFCKARGMSIVHEVSVAAGHALQGIRAGNDKLASHKLADGLPPGIQVHSVAFEPGTPLPISCTIEGVGAPPALRFASVPEAAQSLVVLCEDPDAPQLEPFVHWLVYGIPSSASDVDAQTQHDYRIGENSKDEIGYTPAAPTTGAWRAPLPLPGLCLGRVAGIAEGKTRPELLEAMTGHLLSWGEIVGTYERE